MSKSHEIFKTAQVLEGTKEFYLVNLKSLLDSKAFVINKQYGDWKCIQTAEGYKGMAFTASSEEEGAEFKVETQVVLLSPGVILLTYETIDSMRSIVFRDDSSEAATFADAFLGKYAESKTDETIATERNTKTDPFLLQMSLVFLNQEILRILGVRL